MKISFDLGKNGGGAYIYIYVRQGSFPVLKFIMHSLF